MENSNCTINQICCFNFWDQNFSWDIDDPELVNCFQKTVLTWIPCLFLWVFLPLEAHYLVNSKTKNIPITWLFFIKFLLTAALIFLSIVDLGKIIIENYSSNSVTVYITDYVTLGGKIVTFFLALVLLLYNKKFGMRTSGLLWLFWFFLALCGTIQYRSLLMKTHDEVDSKYDFVSYMIYYPIVVIMFLLNFMVDAEPTFSEYPPMDKQCPEQNASFPSRLIFGWFDSLAWKGFKHPLKSSDLWSTNPFDMTKEFVKVFDKYWNKSSNPQEAKITFEKHYNNVNVDNKKEKKRVSILLSLCKSFGPVFLFSVMLKFIQDILTFISPQILKLLINFTETNEPIWKGYFYAILLFSITVIQLLVSYQYFYRIDLVGLNSRTVLTAEIYRKALRLSNSARKESTVGEIVNLMCVDTKKINNVVVYLNLIWSAPLQIILSLYFLWEILGPAALCGFTFMIILIPINAMLIKKLTKLQIKQMKKKDERVKLINEVLNGIKVLKLYAWEPSFEEEILKIRNKEIDLLRRAIYFDVGSFIIRSCAPFMVSLISFATFVLIDENNVLDSKTAFVSLCLFNNLRSPLSRLPMMISSTVEASVSVKRINKFMNLEELDLRNLQHDPLEESSLMIKNGNFSWESKNIKEPTLQNININIKQGQLVAIVGTVGSGKSSLISALLGEMEKLSGCVNTKGSISYVPQQAWILNATVQDNILFGKSLDQTLYDKVVEACALTPDFEMLPAGDQTEIGEKGINLSGGQKQRVSLARAVYNNSDIYFLDDPLSAVDSHVGKHIFENIIGPHGLMKKKTRLLVTHGITYLPEVDQIIVLKDGEVSESGTYKELLDKRGAFADFLIQHLQEVKSEEEEDVENLLETKQKLGNKTDCQKSSPAKSIISKKVCNNQSVATVNNQQSERSLIQSSCVIKKEQAQCKTGEKLIEIEKAETGSVKWKVYHHYLKCMGWFLAASTIITNVVFTTFSISANLWLSAWSTDNEVVNNETVNTAKRDMYLGVYGAFGIGQAITCFLSDLAPQLGGLLAARHMHNIMLHGVMRAPLSFFDTTPIGRITSRFAKDVDVMDTSFSLDVSNAIHYLFEITAALGVISYSTPIFTIVVVPIGLVYYFIQRFYIPTSRQLKRLESITLSPVYSHFSETLAGVQTIRAYGVQDQFITESDNKIDENRTCSYTRLVAEKWLAVRLEMIGNFIVLFAAIFAVMNKDTMNSGLVGLSIIYGLQITKSLMYLVRTISSVETNIVSAERIKEYSETPQEAESKISDQDPPKDWPSQGGVEFHDYKVRYREGLDLVLNGLSFNVSGGEKIGIVGRTGAGKSSLTLALFRIIEAADGKILIDSVDVSKLGLHTLRSRLTIIPQDPVLFSGSLRLNLDPFVKYSDDDVWRALENAHLKDFVKSLPNGLTHEVTEGGDNLSVGQRQLICLARALLRKTKVLVLDEATAAVDLETDDLIQRTIREQFKECTILTIAHRLNTILDSDRIIVLDKGSIVEFDSPNNLLQKQNSSFYSMAKDAGLI